MCAVSMIGDFYGDQFRQKPWFPQGPQPWVVNHPSEISRAEFDELKRQVAEMKELLKRAKDYDERNGEPECEIDEKMDVLRKVAKLVGIDLDDVIGGTKTEATNG